MGPVPECLRLVHGKELPVPQGWNSRLPTWKPQAVPSRWNSWFPTWEAWVTIASTCRFHMLELTVANMGTTGYHCKQLPVSRGREFLVPNLGTRDYHCK